jgi:hypothetical protein
MSTQLSTLAVEGLAPTCHDLSSRDDISQRVPQGPSDNGSAGSIRI